MSPDPTGSGLTSSRASQRARDAAVTTVANGVRARWPNRFGIGYGAGAHPRVPAAVASFREEVPAASRVVVASYLLAPGYFHDRLHEAGADVVTAPLGPDPRLALIALDRYDAAIQAARGAFLESSPGGRGADPPRSARQTSSLLDQRAGIQSA